MGAKRTERRIKTALAGKPTVIDPDRQTKKQLSHAERFVIQVEMDTGENGEDMFLVILGSRLSEHSDLVEQSMERAQKLRILFVMLDTNINSIIGKITNKPWRSLQRNLFLFDEWSQVDRILHAWRDHLQEERIAAAWVEGNSLFVKSCSLKSYSIEFSKLKSLSLIKSPDREKFQIDQFGRHLYWPDYDIHVDAIDAIRYHTDKKYKKLRDLQDIARNSNYGAAIANLREKHSLTQKDIEELTGLTDRQLRRVEREGHPITIDVAEKLSVAHGMKLNDYLRSVASMLFELTKEKKPSKTKR